MSHLSFWLPWLVTALLVAVIAHALFSGTIRGRRKLPLFTRKDDPADYWIAVGVAICLAVGMFSVAVLQ